MVKLIRDSKEVEKLNEAPPALMMEVEPADHLPDGKYPALYGGATCHFEHNGKKFYATHLSQVLNGVVESFVTVEGGELIYDPAYYPPKRNMPWPSNTPT